jgi:hypothetical protein
MQNPVSQFRTPQLCPRFSYVVLELSQGNTHMYYSSVRSTATSTFFNGSFLLKSYTYNRSVFLKVTVRSNKAFYFENDKHRFKEALTSLNMYSELL